MDFKVGDTVMLVIEESEYKRLPQNNMFKIAYDKKTRFKVVNISEISLHVMSKNGPYIDTILLKRYWKKVPNLPIITLRKKTYG